MAEKTKIKKTEAGNDRFKNHLVSAAFILQ